MQTGGAQAYGPEAATTNTEPAEHAQSIERCYQLNEEMIAIIDGMNELADKVHGDDGFPDDDAWPVINQGRLAYESATDVGQWNWYNCGWKIDRTFRILKAYVKYVQNHPKIGPRPKEHGGLVNSRTKLTARR